MQLQIDYPDSLPDLLQTTRPQFEAEARMAMAVKLYELKRLSSGLAARLAGVSRVEFLLGLHRYGVPMIAHEEAELATDLAQAWRGLRGPAAHARGSDAGCTYRHSPVSVKAAQKYGFENSADRSRDSGA